MPTTHCRPPGIACEPTNNANTETIAAVTIQVSEKRSQNGMDFPWRDNHDPHVKSGRLQRRQVAGLDRRLAEACEKPIELFDRYATWRNKFNADRAVIGIKVNHKARLNAFAPSAALLGFTRQMEISGENFAVTERDFKVRLLHTSPKRISSDDDKQFRLFVRFNNHFPRPAVVMDGIPPPPPAYRANPFPRTRDPAFV